MAKEVRTEKDTTYEQECRRNVNHVQTIHKRKVTTTTTYYDDDSSEITEVERGDWYDTGDDC